MTTQTVEQLVSKQCEACEGKTDRLSTDEIRDQLAALSGWWLSGGGRQICKEWQATNFAAGMAFLDKVLAIGRERGASPRRPLAGIPSGAD